MFGVETNSFLPNDQGDGRNLARQGEARNRWLRASGNARLVEILERSAGSSRSRGRTFENIFQIVIMIFVQTPNGQEFLGTSELATHEPVFPTGVKSSAPGRSRPTVAAWCESDGVSASARPAEPLEWVQSRESAAAISPRCVSGSLPITLVALAGAKPLRRRTADHRVRRGGARHLRRSWPATPCGNGVHTPAGRHKEWPSFGRLLSGDSSPGSDRG